MFEWEGTSIQWPNQNNGHLVFMIWTAHSITFSLQNKNLFFFFLVYISVACEVVLGVNTLKVQLIFPFKPNFCNLLNFQWQNPLKNPYLPHLTSEHCEINSIKSNLPKAFQWHQEHHQIPIQFQLFYLGFIEKMVQ